jgi:hypothetical protein
MPLTVRAVVVTDVALKLLTQTSDHCLPPPEGSVPNWYEQYYLQLLL